MHRHHGVVSASLIVGCTLLGCGENPVAPPPVIPPPVVPEPSGLTPVASHALSVSEPSGLTIDATGKALWTVSNEGIQKLDLQGNLLETVDYVGEDLEGIAHDPSDGTLWVVEERRREVVHLKTDGVVLSRYQLALGGSENSGLEGVCLDRDGNVYALNEKNPALFLEVHCDPLASSDLEIVLEADFTQHSLSFGRDCSGLAYSGQADRFWMLSDEEKSLYLWSLSAGVLREYSLPFPKPEGIAFDAAAGLLYIVSDAEDRLYVYRIEE